jgi:hypothetical protein
MSLIKLLFLLLKSIGKNVYILSYKIVDGDNERIKKEYFDKFVNFYLRYMDLRNKENIKDLIIIFR